LTRQKNSWQPGRLAEREFSLINKLKKDGYEVVALEQDEKSIDYRKYKKSPKMAFILGPEVTGLDKKILKYCDKIVEIPMKGKKESLNVSVACGVALFGIIK
jgi:tRNA G18 (ribose-2'-O)-methylase SpoU